jgi:hypothetical protein
MFSINSLIETNGFNSGDGAAGLDEQCDEATALSARSPNAATK